MSPISAIPALNIGPLSGVGQALGPLSPPLEGLSGLAIPTSAADQPGLAPAEQVALGGGTSFGSILANQIANLQHMQNVTDVKATQAATGDLTDIHDYMIAANQSALTAELTVAIRNKALEAFNEIMRLQL